MWECSPAWNSQCWYLHMLLLVVYLHNPKTNICSWETVDLGTEKSQKRNAYAKRETMTVHLKLCSSFFWRPQLTVGVFRSEILTMNVSFYLQAHVLFLFPRSVGLRAWRLVFAQRMTQSLAIVSYSSHSQ